jgi:hypothetical protein
MAIAQPSTETRMVNPGHYVAPSSFWQNYPRPAGTIEVRCAHCRCWFGLHSDRAINACQGGCYHCPGFTPASNVEEAAA